MQGFHIFDASTLDELEKLEKISNNCNSKVTKVSKKTIYVLKTLKNKNINSKDLKHFISEYETMSSLNHPNILKAFGIYTGKKKTPPSILLEYCPMNLDEAIKEESLSKVQIALTIYEIASGMKYIHDNQIIHHNIKPTNILISSDGQAKIADIGVYELLSQDEEIGVGAQKFMAPEIINEEEYNEKIDVYSFGVLVYFILNGGKLPKITITQIGMGKKAQIPKTFTEFSRQLIDSCWNFKPKDRPSFNEINEQLVNSAHELLDLTKHEIKEVKNFIENHQKIIPPCQNACQWPTN